MAAGVGILHEDHATFQPVLGGSGVGMQAIAGMGELVSSQQDSIDTMPAAAAAGVTVAPRFVRLQ